MKMRGFWRNVAERVFLPNSPYVPCNSQLTGSWVALQPVKANEPEAEVTEPSSCTRLGCKHYPLPSEELGRPLVEKVNPELLSYPLRKVILEMYSGIAHVRTFVELTPTLWSYLLL